MNFLPYRFLEFVTLREGRRKKIIPAINSAKPD